MDEQVKEEGMQEDQVVCKGIKLASFSEYDKEGGDKSWT